MYYHYKPGSNIVIVYCKHITHAHTHAWTRVCTHVRTHVYHTCTHKYTHVHTHSRRRHHRPPHRLSLFGGAQPTVTARSACDNAGRGPFKSTHELATRFTRGFGSFQSIKKLLGRTESRTRDRMYCQTIRIVKLETFPETIEQELRPAVCDLQFANADRQTDGEL